MSLVQSLTPLRPRAWSYKLVKPNKMVQKWFKFAQDDLIAAKALWDLQNERLWRPITFHSQQAAEKAIKGFLAFKKIAFIKNHDINKLAEKVEVLHPELRELLTRARDLIPYAVQFRYPDAVVKDLEKHEVEEALNIATQVLKEMSSLIPFDSLFDI